MSVGYFTEDSTILPQFCDDLFQSWSTELGIAILPEKEPPTYNYDKITCDEEAKDLLDFSILKTIEASSGIHHNMMICKI